MPTYRYFCVECGEFEEWRSIHETEPMETHSVCGNTVARVYNVPALHGIGAHGSRTREVDATEKQWSSDMDAYYRLRKDGLQPKQIDGCHDLERDGKTAFEIQTGIRGVPEYKIQESWDLAREAGVV